MGLGKFYLLGFGGTNIGMHRDRVEPDVRFVRNNLRLEKNSTNWWKEEKKMKCPNCRVLLNQMKKDVEKIRELESERERLSKLLIEARVKIVELEEEIQAIMDLTEGG